jgi:hypothetical protein
VTSGFGSSSQGAAEGHKRRGCAGIFADCAAKYRLRCHGPVKLDRKEIIVEFLDSRRDLSIRDGGSIVVYELDAQRAKKVRDNRESFPSIRTPE